MATDSTPLTYGSRKGSLPTLGRPGASVTSAPGAIGGLPDDLMQPAPMPAAAMRSQVQPGQAVPSIDRAIPSESPFEKAARLARENKDLAAARQANPRVYEGGTPVTPIEKAVASLPEGERVAVRSARRDINAVKTVARLVAAIARKPGSGVPNAIKSSHLGELLRAVNAAAGRIAASLAPNDAHRAWVKVNATEAAVGIVARQWEEDPHDEMRPVDAQIEALEDVFRDAQKDEALAQALDDLSQARYTEATDHEVAAARINLSARLAAWDLYASVMNPLLGRGSYRFTYGQDATQIVNRLMPEIYAIARDNPLRTDFLDLRTAHMQGSLRRLADLMGAEYVARTRALMNWISEEGISTEQYRSRLRTANEKFESSIVPDLVDWTRRNFMAVEAMSARLVEEGGQVEQRAQRPAQK